MRRTDLPSMKSCDGCRHEVQTNACCTLVRVRPQEAKRIKRYVEDNDIHWLKQEGIQCGFLKDGQCGIYEVRPWMCRAFGVIQQAPCSRFPEEAQLDFPPKLATELRLSDPNDALLGFYFEPGYYDRMKQVLAPQGYNLETYTS